MHPVQCTQGPNTVGCAQGSVRSACARHRWFGWVLLLLMSWVVADGFDLNEALLERIEIRYGSEARERVVRWDRLMHDYQDLSEPEKLLRVNEFFNEQAFVSDAEHWGRNDYWATPVEFLATSGGDCEDFAVAKYFTLREMGVPVERMTLTYVKALELNQAHMVLTYAATPGAVPLVLDNLREDILPASQRRDLLPVYSFNGEGLWLAKERGRGKLVGSSSRLSLWTDLVQRMAEYEK